MMNKEEILQKENGNDGRSVFLYYDDTIGLYLAFGLSAYYTTLVSNPYMSYSEDLNMPVALLRRDCILYLRQSMRKVEHEQKKFYHFEMNQPLGKAGYDKWEQMIHSKHNNN